MNLMERTEFIRILYVFTTLFLILPSKVSTDDDSEIGTVECVDGKWKIDTRLMALAMTCPLPLDGNADSIMKMAKCVMNKLGVYDGQSLSDDFVETACSIFSQGKLRKECLEKANVCAVVSFIRFSWETNWPLFAGCFLPWAMGVCNI